MRVHTISVVLLGMLGCTSEGEVTEAQGLQAIGSANSWEQVFGNGSHTGKTFASPLTGMRVSNVVIQDEDAEAVNDFNGFLLQHESSPLTSGEFVVVPGSSGFDPEDFDTNTKRYNVQVLRKAGESLTPVWKTSTNWVPVDGRFNGWIVTNGYVPQFQPAISAGDLWMPISRGGVARLNLATGRPATTYQPFAGTAFDTDATIVSNALSVSADGSVWYTAITYPELIQFGRRHVVRGSFLVRISLSGQVTVRDWSTIATAAIGVAQENDNCKQEFEPTSGTQPAPSTPCGLQRPAQNSAVTFRPNGNPIVYSLGINETRAGYLIELDAATLNPIASASMRGHLRTGCGIRLFAENGWPCFADTPLGFDPGYNDFVAYRGQNIHDGSPVVDPDGGVSISGYDGGFTFGGDFDARGSILRFGTPLNGRLPLLSKNEAYGWEVTPSVRLASDGTWSFYQDFNLYSDLDLRIAKLSPEYTVQTSGAIGLDFDRVAIDWLDAHIPIDRDGNFYATNGMGVLVKFSPNGTPVGHVVLPEADGAGQRSMETLSGYYAWGQDGTLYASYAGNVYAIQSGIGPDVPPPAMTPSSSLQRSVAAKRASLRGVH